MNNKKILEILGNPVKYFGDPIWIDMIFAVRRLMEENEKNKEKTECLTNLKTK